jgi:hypothetical protein
VKLILKELFLAGNFKYLVPILDKLLTNNVSGIYNILVLNLQLNYH